MSKDDVSLFSVNSRPLRLWTAVHNDAIDRGQELAPEIRKAINESSASIVVLSENYTNSRWCLNELYWILEQRRKCGNFVLPVFYHVDPSDVRNQTRSFAIEGSKGRVDDVRRWKEALTKVANLTGEVLSSSGFVEEIGKHYKYGMLELQKQLLIDVLGGKERISSVSEGTHNIVEVLQTKKVLIVLDDIDDQDQLNTLLGTKAFPTQSKIIITTRLLDIDAWFGSISWRCWVHKLKFLNDLESLELLSWHAFRSKVPMEGFEEVATHLARYCKYMVTILKEDLFAKFGIMALINICLLTVSRDTGELMMHQLLQDMGRKIADGNCPLYALAWISCLSLDYLVKVCVRVSDWV
ncbi:hypothetical protein L1987_01472 [Smallanthus sonchifolius]|uniref:Uncharacterized protein n=1 Tax=Smallanthus sonchifolius TaxID=185202 RepID=A0ACB9K549_9ASTR|nr:hypothetical protein L1987_01472 [Smallanthus sonchifolius]